MPVSIEFITSDVNSHFPGSLKNNSKFVIVLSRVHYWVRFQVLPLGMFMFLRFYHRELKHFLVEQTYCGKLHDLFTMRFLLQFVSWTWFVQSSERYWMMFVYLFQIQISFCFYQSQSRIHKRCSQKIFDSQSIML